MLDKIGKYEVSEQIGVGGFGAVYRGRDPFIKRTVAIKTCQVNDEEIKNRFFREAELAGNLHHRNITTIYDFGVENGIPYIVQEFLTGEDLDKKIKRGEPMPVARKVEILMAIADGLGYAHAATSSTATSSPPTSGSSRTARSRSWTSGSPSRCRPSRT